MLDFLITNADVIYMKQANDKKKVSTMTHSQTKQIAVFSGLVLIALSTIVYVAPLFFQLGY